MIIKTLTKLFSASKQMFVCFSFFWEKMGISVFLNTPNSSLTLIISQMHWIVTHVYHRNTNKLLTTSKQVLLVLASFGRKSV